MQAGETLDLVVSVRLDETMTFSDTLHMLVANGSEVNIPLSAVGTGSTLSCDALDGQQELQFGHQFTGAPFEKMLTVVNNGRRPMNVAWVNSELERVKQELGKVSALG